MLVPLHAAVVGYRNFLFGYIYCAITLCMYVMYLMLQTDALDRIYLSLGVRTFDYLALCAFIHL